MESTLEDYDISPVTGFLPSTPPLRRLPSYYEPWEVLLDNFHVLMLAGRLRSSINKLSVLDTNFLKTLAEYHRAFLVLSSLAHGYVWDKFDEVSDRLPACIAKPWVKVSDYLGISPVVNHAAVVLWNWRLIFPDKPFDLNNLATLFTFSNTLDESWFYLVTTAIEGFGGRALTAIMSAIHAIKVGNNQNLTVALRDINSTIVDINATLQRMHEKCDPYVFYWMVRPYLNGWENEDRLPRGLIYEGVDGNDENGNPIYRRYVGASAGQSALIQALDIALNIEHYPTGVKPQINGHCPMKNYTSGNSCFRFDSKFNNNDTTEQYSPDENNIKLQQPYLYKIRQSMTGRHRKFLEDLAKVANIRDYIISQMGYDSSITASSPDEDMEMLPGTNEMVQAYNECLNQMKNFRSKHLQLVSIYIVIQERRNNSGSHSNSMYYSSINKGNVRLLY
ncbi:6136_t:CDS:2 [Dentiscutata heterogama]|uniref:6136_t:CDS:1 n=1 Tax=Dentiscutata heterogama TaxID=1316150 RepID=A0ACA9LUM9_9GLOM|nr:6136_t:CDS:2 [Dentiscutata heterogama]